MPKPALSITRNLTELQRECRLVEAEECLRSAFWTDVRPGTTAVETRARAGRRSLSRPFATVAISNARPRNVGAKTKMQFRVMPESATPNRPEIHLKP